MSSHDLYLVIGLVLCGLAIPALLGAMADRRRPSAALLTLVIGGGLVALAMSQRPGGYALEEIPHAFVRVVAHFTR